MTFTKADSADWTLQQNQDRLTDSVWITRQSRQSIFNIAIEEESDGGLNTSNNPLSPQKTEWAIGTIEDGIETLDFFPFIEYHSYYPIVIIGIPSVLHLFEEDIYIDITMNSWTSGANGGGFSYTRSTPSQDQE